MKKSILPGFITLALLIFLSFSSCTTTFYIVRHAEKVSQSDTTHLTEAGRARAIVLRDSLQKNPPSKIFSTNKNRTKETAAPTASFTGVTVQLYSNDTLDLFITRLKKITSKSVLVVGHSESVGDIVNGLMGEAVMGYIPENNFDTLMVVRYSRGNNLVKRVFHKRYGPASPPQN